MENGEPVEDAAFGQAIEEYEVSPSSTFARIAQLAVGAQRSRVLATLAGIFYKTRNWRVAQHLALLHLDQVPPRSGVQDVVLAVLFADHARRESDGHPMAFLVHARACWARRVPDAVLYDCDRAEEGGRASELPALVQGELRALRSMAHAYCGQAVEAYGRLQEAIELGCNPMTRIEAVVQLLLVSDRHHSIALWAAWEVAGMRLPATADDAAKKALRRRLLAVLGEMPG